MWDCKWRTRRHCRLDCRRIIPAATRFWARVDISGGRAACWPWTGSRDAKTYGKFVIQHGTSPALAHRYSWQLHNGPIPAGLIVRHTCDNPSCVNPSHLLTGTHEDNANDMIVRGRSGLSKLTVEKVRQIRRRLAQGERRMALAREFSVDRATIGSIARGSTWRTA